MQIISPSTFNAIIHTADANLIKTTYDRPKLLESAQGKMIKVFYAKHKRFSSNHRKPYALRFSENAVRLQNNGIRTPSVDPLQYCKEYDAYILTYSKIPGENTRILANLNHQFIIPRIAEYIASIHHKGIFFRSLHLENLLYDDIHGFALLDIVDVKFMTRPLHNFLRYRNLKHMFRIADDREFWQKYGVHQFMNIYFEVANLSAFSKGTLKILLKL